MKSLCARIRSYLNPNPVSPLIRFINDNRGMLFAKSPAQVRIYQRLRAEKQRSEVGTRDVTRVGIQPRAASRLVVHVPREQVLRKKKKKAFAVGRLVGGHRFSLSRPVSEYLYLTAPTEIIGCVRIRLGSFANSLLHRAGYAVGSQPGADGTSSILDSFYMSVTHQMSVGVMDFEF